jgi:hypothetical protein
MCAAVASVPSLSSLMAWPTEHLTEAADYWTITGNRWYDAFAQTWQDSLSVEWTGTGAEALHTRTHADKAKVSDLADQLHEAAKVARAGASDLFAARSRVRYAVQDARAAGFLVSEDLSVLDRSTGGSPATRVARQAQAQAFAADIRQRAAQLVAVDQQAAGRISTVMAGVGGIFPKSPTTTPTPQPSECTDPTELLHDWNELIAEINEHNAKTYDPYDPAEVAAYEAEYLRLNAKLLKLSSELLDCGIPTTITPAPTPGQPR